MSALLRRFGLLLVLLANRLDQRSPLTLALEPLAPAATHAEVLADMRWRFWRYY